MAPKSIRRDEMHVRLHQGSLQTHKRGYPDTILVCQGLVFCGTCKYGDMTEHRRCGMVRKRKHCLASCYPFVTFIDAGGISLLSLEVALLDPVFIGRFS